MPSETQSSGTAVQQGAETAPATVEAPAVPAYQPNLDLITYIERGDAGNVEKRG